MDIELKPCPFCGGRPHISDHSYKSIFSDVQFPQFDVKHTCQKSPAGIQFNIYSTGYETPEAAAAAWNRRVEDAT